MRVHTALSAAAVLGAAALAAPAALAQSTCLMGGDANAELACGLAGYSAGGAAPARRDAAAPSRITSGRASGEITSPSDRAAPSRITSPGGLRPASRPALPEPYAYREDGRSAPYVRGEGAIAAEPLVPLQAPPAPAPQTEYAYAPPGGDYAAWRGQGAQAAPPPAPARPAQIAVEGGGTGPAPSAFGYSYETADGAAFAWRYETPSGPAWAYAYDTPEGRAYAWAYEPPAPDLPVYAARDHRPAPPPPAHGAHRAPPPDPGPPPLHLDWRYADELRLYGRSFPRLLVVAETWYREGRWVTVDRRPLPSSCHTCLSPGPGPVHGPVGGSGGFFSAGGGGGFAAAAARAEAEAAARAGFSNRSSFEAFSESAAFAETAGPSGNAVSGTPFTFPGGWPGAQ